MGTIDCIIQVRYSGSDLKNTEVHILKGSRDPGITLEELTYRNASVDQVDLTIHNYSYEF